MFGKYQAGRADALSECVERLEAEAERVSGERRRTYFARAARVADDELSWHDKAVRLYSRALEAASDTPLDLVRRQTIALARAVGREEEALEQFRRFLSVEPGEPELYRAMLEMFEREQVYERTRLLRQMLRTLGEDVEAPNVRSKTTPSRSFDDEGLESHLLPEGLSPGLFHLLGQTMPLLRKVCSEELPDRQPDGTRPARGEASAAREAFEDATYAFELGRHDVVVGESGPRPPQLIGDKPAFWMRQDLFEAFGAPAYQFTAGYLSALARSGIAPLRAVDGALVWHLIEATWLYHEGESLAGETGDDVAPRSRQMTEAISSPFLTVARRRLLRAIEPVREKLIDASPGAWSVWIEDFARRAGLVLSGNLGASIQALLRFRGADVDGTSPDRAVRTEADARLVQFAFTDDYLAARYDVGLGGRPSQVGLGRSF